MLLGRTRGRGGVGRMGMGLAELADLKKLVCIVDSRHLDNADLVTAVVGILSANGLSFTDIRKGSTLEERFLDVTDGQG